MNVGWFVALLLWAVQAIAFLRSARVIVNGRAAPASHVVALSLAWPLVALGVVFSRSDRP